MFQLEYATRVMKGSQVHEFDVLSNAHHSGSQEERRKSHPVEALNRLEIINRKMPAYFEGHGLRKHLAGRKTRKFQLR